jgi:serine/threonine protein kinase
MENYRSIKRLGEGAFGEVSLCEDLRTGQRCALKKVPVRRREQGLSVGVWREFKAMQFGAHPNVVQVDLNSVLAQTDASMHV